MHYWSSMQGSELGNHPIDPIDSEDKPDLQTKVSPGKLLPAYQDHLPANETRKSGHI